MTINRSKVDQYINEEMIMEFSSQAACMEYLNTYDSQHFQSIDEMIAFQGEYGFGIGDKWYHICFQEALDVLQPLPFPSENNK